MAKYAVVFAPDCAMAELRVKACKYKFETLKAARIFADGYYNAYIMRIDNNGILNHCKTRQQLRR